MEYSFDEMIDRLKKIKKERKLTNEQLSNLSGVPFGTLNKILGSETKETNISTVIKLANAIGVTAEELIFGIEPAIKDNITQHERDIINAYREQPESVKIAICKMLDVEVEIPQKTVIFRAASSDDNHPAEIIETDIDFSKIPTTDIDL